MRVSIHESVPWQHFREVGSGVGLGWVGVGVHVCLGEEATNGGFVIKEIRATTRHRNDTNRVTALHLAAENGHLEMVTWRFHATMASSRSEPSRSFAAGRPVNPGGADCPECSSAPVGPFFPPQDHFGRRVPKERKVSEKGRAQRRPRGTLHTSLYRARVINVHFSFWHGGGWVRVHKPTVDVRVLPIHT